MKPSNAPKEMVKKVKKKSALNNKNFPKLKRAKNDVCANVKNSPLIPIKPKDPTSREGCLAILLSGGKLSVHNAPCSHLNSIISAIRNEMYIPIVSERKGQYSEYSMAPDEIERYKNPELRIKQKAQVQEQVVGNRLRTFFIAGEKKRKFFIENPKWLREMKSQIDELVRNFSNLLKQVSK